MPFFRQSYDTARITHPKTGASRTVDVADTFLEKYRGLSEYETPPTDSGLLFVHLIEKNHSYVMRGMTFPIDIIFLTSEFTVDTVHHSVPADAGMFDRFTGYGKYVLETPAGWADEVSLEEGDSLKVEFCD